MKFAEAAERLRLARLEGKTAVFHAGGLWEIGGNCFGFWWCCRYNGSGETQLYVHYGTVEGLISERGDNHFDWT